MKQQRHFKVQTAGGIEDIHCDDIDESKTTETWFIFTNLPPRIFRKSQIISIQEMPPFDQEKWDRMVRENQDPPDNYESEY
jgi:hypothetical protein